MHSHREGGAIPGCWWRRGCSWWFSLKAGEEEVDFFCQRSVALSSSNAGSVVGEVLDCHPCLPAVVAVTVFVNPPPEILLGLTDASLQVAAGCAVESPVASFEGGVSLLQQLLHHSGHPGFLVGVDPDASLHCDRVYTVLDVTQYSVRKYIQVLVLKDVPVSAVETVLQLLSSTIWPCSDGLYGGGGSFRREVYAGMSWRKIWSDLPKCGAGLTL